MKQTQHNNRMKIMDLQHKQDLHYKIQSTTTSQVMNNKIFFILFVVINKIFVD
jgi:hypothetical protein